MTSEYDKLRCIADKAKQDKAFLEVTNWLVDICIEQANKAKKDWNFENWSSSKIGAIYREGFERKVAFISDCHSVLAHQHIEAFDGDTLKLINEIYCATCGEDVYDVDKLKKRFPELLKFLEQLGYKPLDKRGWMWAKTSEKVQ